MMIGRLRLRNGVFLAPMAGITDLPFRTIVREFGCGLAFTEMVSANGLLRGKGKTTRYLDSSPVDRPLGVQLFGSDPATLSEAARIAAESGADLLDINMGCPVKKVIKTGSGAALMRDPQAGSRHPRCSARGGRASPDSQDPRRMEPSRNKRLRYRPHRRRLRCGCRHPPPAHGRSGFRGDSGLGAYRFAQGATADPCDRER